MAYSDDAIRAAVERAQARAATRIFIEDLDEIERGYPAAVETTLGAFYAENPEVVIDEEALFADGEAVLNMGAGGAYVIALAEIEA